MVSASARLGAAAFHGYIIDKMTEICGNDAVSVVGGVHHTGWDISEPMVNERTGRLCFLVRLNDLDQEPVTFMQMTGGAQPEKVHTAPPNFKGKTLPDRIVDDGLNGPMKGAIVQIKAEYHRAVDANQNADDSVHPAPAEYEPPRRQSKPTRT